ncbi:MAG TPA: hypothetical protein ENJ84_01190 [Gammaproteobacteria bacterium]|nr:hypothetical protein [Gammaproteobacteria bacterium]
MKQRTAIPLQKETTPPQKKGLLSHAALLNTAEQGMSSNGSAETSFGHDFSQIAVRPLVPITGQDYSNASCPPRILTKRKTGKPGEKYERKGDRMVDQVMRTPGNMVGLERMWGNHRTKRLSHDFISTMENAKQTTNSKSQKATKQSGILGRSEAAFGPALQDGRKKRESNALTRGLIGAGIGAGAGAIIGAVAGGPIGAGIGAVLGGAVGALIGALAGRGRGITWKAPNYTAHASNNASTTVEKPFIPTYRAIEDTASNTWRLKIDSIKGGVDIDVYTGGSRDPVTTPPTTEAEAQNAVNVMKGYYARGNRGAWHTEAASRAHEEYHYREWKCSAEHYWPTAKTALESLTVSRATHATEATAIASLRAGANGADSKLQAFRNVAHNYWFTLADNASSRPYAAGQLVLNKAIRQVQRLASRNGWTVPRGVDRPSTATPCYQPWTPYNP